MRAELLCGDCLELMPQLAEGSADMVLCDLPYGTTQNRWDTPIDLPSLWAQYNRVCAGVVALHAAQPFTSVLVCSNLRHFRYDWTWRKPKGTGHLNAKRMPMRNKEDILIFSRRSPVYNPQFTEGAPFGNKRGANSECYGQHGAVNYENSGLRYPLQVLDFPVVERGTVHPTQKPVPLLEYLIRTYTNEGDTVLDNTMGSGSTGVACMNTGRNFIGIEKDEAYFKIAQERIAAAQAANTPESV